MGSIRRGVTAAEFARSQGITTGHVYALLREGALPAIRLGRTVRVDVDAWEARLTAVQAQNEHAPRANGERVGASEGSLGGHGNGRHEK